MSNLIKLYGEFWNPDVVDWGTPTGNKVELLGDTKKNGKYLEGANFTNARGIYVLYENFKAIYVGKAFKRSLGPRIKDHLRDRLAGRWDMFSWYSTSDINSTDAKIRHAGGKHIAPDLVVDTLEALAILISDPALNRKRESLPEALEVLQSSSPKPHTIRHYLQRILDEVEKESESGTGEK